MRIERPGAGLLARGRLGLLAWLLVLSSQTTALRLVYPAAIVLVEHARAGLGVALAMLSAGISLVRGWTTDRVIRGIRLQLFAAVSETIERYPALAPPGAPPVEQLESEIARGIPWVEALVGVTLPTIFGDLAALPLIALLAWARIGAGPTLIASGAMASGVIVGAFVSRKVGTLAEVAWGHYQPVAQLIEAGFRGRVELSVHGRSGAHRARLLKEVANWSVADRRAFVWGGLAAWSVPIATAVSAIGFTTMVGAHPFLLLQEALNHPSRPLIVSGLLALTALPVLASLSRGLADYSKERPHLHALERFVGSVIPGQRRPNDGPPSGAPPLDVICAERVRFRYPSRNEEEPSLVGADLAWEAHETLAICGANGCGKTTLTWLLMGILEPEEGTISVSIGGAIYPPSALRGRVAYLPQQPYFEEPETVRDAIRFVAPETPDERVRSLISSLLAGHFTGDVDALLARPVMSLSMGERRMVALARVLMRKSDLVILDEPEANLDSDLRQRAIDALSRQKSHSRMLIVTHDAAFAAIADRVYRMPSATRPHEAMPAG